jgi:hypothetical protein
MLLPASGEYLLDFQSPRHLSSSGSYPLDLSGLGDPIGSNATAGLALRVTGTHKHLYHGKLEIPINGNDAYMQGNAVTPRNSCRRDTLLTDVPHELFWEQIRTSVVDSNSQLTEI